ncbi:hypothetical protein KY289_008075 [Solanum tuberosum]|nr:hypothetical protein KY289_008075 [Solanum tuberosum]
MVILDFEEDDLDDVSDQDDSEVDEELRAFREKLREEKKMKLQSKKKRTKKPLKDQGVELGEVGIDKGFENIFTNKAAKYNGKLRGDEVFIDSSDEPSEDSDEELDVLAQPGVDLPSRRKSNKLRNVVADYVVHHKVQLRLKPNEPHRVRVKCEGKCKWEIFASLDKDSGIFFIKKYYPAHRCISKNRNRLCTTKYVEMKMRDKIISQSDMAKVNVIAKFLGDWKLEFSRYFKVKGRKKKQPTARATSSSTAWTSSSSVGTPLPSSVERPPTSSVGRKRTKDVKFGVYTDIQTGRQVINLGRSSEVVISSGSGVAFKDASQTNVDLGFKPPDLKWKVKDAMTENQLQQLSKKKVQSKSKGKWVP